jgi:hypothetical protein
MLRFPPEKGVTFFELVPHDLGSIRKCASLGRGTAPNCGSVYLQYQPDDTPTETSWCGWDHVFLFETEEEAKEALQEYRKMWSSK